MQLARINYLFGLTLVLVPVAIAAQAQTLLPVASGNRLLFVVPYGKEKGKLPVVLHLKEGAVPGIPSCLLVSQNQQRFYLVSNPPYKIERFSREGKLELSTGLPDSVGPATLRVPSNLRNSIVIWDREKRAPLRIDDTTSLTLNAKKSYILPEVPLGKEVLGFAMSWGSKAWFEVRGRDDSRSHIDIYDAGQFVRNVNGQDLLAWNNRAYFLMLNAKRDDLENRSQGTVLVMVADMSETEGPFSELKITIPIANGHLMGVGGGSDKPLLFFGKGGCAYGFEIVAVSQRDEIVGRIPIILPPSCANMKPLKDQNCLFTVTEDGTAFIGIPTEKGYVILENTSLRYKT